MTTHLTPSSPVPAYTTPPRPARGRYWWVPLAIIAEVLIGAVIVVSQSRECAPVDRSLYPTDSAQTAALERGDTIPAADPRSGTAVSVHACTWRSRIGSRP